MSHCCKFPVIVHRKSQLWGGKLLKHPQDALGAVEGKDATHLSVCAPSFCWATEILVQNIQEMQAVHIMSLFVSVWKKQLFSGVFSTWNQQNLGRFPRLWNKGLTFGVVNTYDLGECTGPFKCQNIKHYGPTARTPRDATTDAGMVAERRIIQSSPFLF